MRTSQTKPSSPLLPPPLPLPCAYFSAAWENPLGVVWQHALLLSHSKVAAKNTPAALAGNPFLTVCPGPHKFTIGCMGVALLSL